MVEGLVGLSYADGIHWIFDGHEIAIANDKLREIEWFENKRGLPKDVVEAVLNSLTPPENSWLIEARRFNISETQGSIGIFVNGVDMDMYFNDEHELVNGKWQSKNKDLGAFICSSLWHPLDNVYHYSDRFKKIFNPDYQKQKMPQQALLQKTSKIVSFTIQLYDVGSLTGTQWFIFSPNDHESELLAEELDLPVEEDYKSNDIVAIMSEIQEKIHQKYPEIKVMFTTGDDKEI